MVVVEPRVTLADIERMIANGEIPEDRQLELVDGEIVWLTFPSPYHNRIVVAIMRLLMPFSDAIGAELGVEGLGFRVGTARQNLRGPDVSLVTRERFGILRG